MRYQFILFTMTTLILSACTTTNEVAEDSSTVKKDTETLQIQKIPGEFSDLSMVSLEDLLRRVEAGDIRAQAELGARYGRGDGVEKDYEKALEILRDAAAKGDPDAEFFIGTAYFSGLGVERSEVQAIDWFTRAADKGHAPAQYWLAVQIKEGTAGISPSWEAAVPLLWKSAVQGYTDAEFLLGYAYQTGSGVDKNPRAAAYWYRRTMSRSPNLRARLNLSLMISRGEVEWQDGDPPELSPAAHERAKSN